MYIDGPVILLIPGKLLLTVLLSRYLGGVLVITNNL